MAQTEEEYRTEQEARQALTDQTLKVTEQSIPIPSQEELDLMRLGLMHVDAKANPDVPEMPSTRAQYALLGIAVSGEDPQVGPPTVVDVPMISGNGTVGETLTCTSGNWDGMQQEVAEYVYLWKADADDLATTGNSHLVDAEEVGKSITCVVTATNTFGATTAPPSNAITINPIGARRSRS
jgi:hypothetical protein